VNTCYTAPRGGGEMIFVSEQDINRRTKRPRHNPENKLLSYIYFPPTLKISGDKKREKRGASRSVHPPGQPF
jgi:hypothetical protein